MQLSDYHFELPAERIAQVPADPRDSSRLMHLDRRTGEVRHALFRELPNLLRPGDCIVLNETRVLPARLHGRLASDGREVEVLLLRPTKGLLCWQALLRPGRRLSAGSRIELGLYEGQRVGAVVGRRAEAKAEVTFDGVAAAAFDVFLAERGQMPLPPYIKRPAANPEDYQTVYSRVSGSVAAPTAGLHFTDSVLAALAARRVSVVKVLLHVGYGTFAPLRQEEVAANQLEEEYYEVSQGAADEINRCRRGGGRVIAVGTTVTRTLETAGAAGGGVAAVTGWSGLFIYPGHRFVTVNGLLTNFHLPKSSTLLLAAAVVPWEHLKGAYDRAVDLGYRFYSYGDAMLVI